MTQQREPNTNDPTWMTDAELRLAGFVARRPEIDYGMRWGSDANVRVSFAPTDANGNGFLYVHDAGRQRYAVLAAQTTFADVEAAWRTMLDRPVRSNDYLEMADLVAPAVTVGDAHTLWLECVEDELKARQAHEKLAIDADGRFDAALAVVVAQSARAASEDVLITAAAADDRTGFGAATVQYRIVGRDGWSGRIAGVDLSAAAEHANELNELAGRHGYDLQATSLRHGQIALAASRVPELQALSHPIHEAPFIAI